MSSPNLAQVLDMAVRGALDGVRVAMPGKVVEYDKAKQRATIQPMVADRYELEGVKKASPLPAITDVPIAFYGAGGYSETFPIGAGDTVLLVFCSSPISRWKVGGGGADGDPGDDRRHALSDAIAYAGIRDFGHALPNVPDDAWVITVPAGKQIRLGSANASDTVMRKSDAQAWMNALDAAINALQAAVAPPPVVAAAAVAIITLQFLKAALSTWLAGITSIVKAG